MSFASGDTRKDAKPCGYLFKVRRDMASGWQAWHRLERSRGASSDQSKEAAIGFDGPRDRP